jgi:hypothetical protein
LTGMNLVEHLGIEPSTSSLQGITPPQRLPRIGVRRRIRTDLSAPSTQRNHQIC